MKFSVQNLRQQGYKVKVYHYRRNRSDCGINIGQSCCASLPTGGMTMVEVITPDNTVLQGNAKCSDLDNYNKRVGVQIALGRAMVNNEAN